MKKIARLLFVPVLLMVVFSLMPTGSSTDEVLTGYQTTTSFSTSGSSYLLYMMQFRLAKDSDYAHDAQSLNPSQWNFRRSCGHAGMRSWQAEMVYGEGVLLQSIQVLENQQARYEFR